MAIRESIPNRKRAGARRSVKKRNGFACRKGWAHRRLHSGFQLCRFLLPAELPQQFIARDAAICGTASQPRKWPTRAHDRVEQTARGIPIAKFHAIGNKRFDAEVLRQRPQNMIQELSHKYNPLAVLLRLEQFLDRLAAKLWLQHVVE